MTYAKPRSAGKLHIGSVIYKDGVVSVEMAYECESTFITPDHVKSATLAATRHFLTILAQNGFKDWEAPEVRVVESEGKFVKFYIGARASKKRPAPIVIASLKGTNGKGRDQADDEA